MSNELRLDLWLVQNGFVESRNKAQDLIDASQVILILSSGAQEILKKASYIVKPQDQIQVLEGLATKYVSRGGLKLEGALARFQISVKGRGVLDLGQSTGGFTDCLLQHGSRFVVGIDVGRGQLHPRLISHPMIWAIEEVHFRDLPNSQMILERLERHQVDMAVVDLSFTSIFPALDAIAQIPRIKEIVGLVKPQFELQAKDLGKGGVVKDSHHFEDIHNRLMQKLALLNWKFLDWIDSPITGKDGNKEFFFHAQTK